MDIIKQYKLPRKAYPRYDYTVAQVRRLIILCQTLLLKCGLKALDNVPLFGDVIVKVQTEPDETLLSEDELVWKKASEPLRCECFSLDSEVQSNEAHPVVFVAPYSEFTNKHVDTHYGNILIFLHNEEFSDDDNFVIETDTGTLAYICITSRKNFSMNLRNILERYVLSTLKEVGLLLIRYLSDITNSETGFAADANMLGTPLEPSRSSVDNNTKHQMEDLLSEISAAFIRSNVPNSEKLIFQNLHACDKEKLHLPAEISKHVPEGSDFGYRFGTFQVIVHEPRVLERSETIVKKTKETLVKHNTSDFIIRFKCKDEQLLYRVEDNTRNVGQSDTTIRNQTCLSTNEDTGEIKRVDDILTPSFTHSELRPSRNNIDHFSKGHSDRLEGLILHNFVILTELSCGRASTKALSNQLVYSNKLAQITVDKTTVELYYVVGTAKHNAVCAFVEGQYLWLTTAEETKYIVTSANKPVDKCIALFRFFTEGYLESSQRSCRCVNSTAMDGQERFLLDVKLVARQGSSMNKTDLQSTFDRVHNYVKSTCETEGYNFSDSTLSLLRNLLAGRATLHGMPVFMDSKSIHLGPGKITIPEYVSSEADHRSYLMIEDSKSDDEEDTENSTVTREGKVFATDADIGSNVLARDPSGDLDHVLGILLEIKDTHGRTYLAIGLGPGLIMLNNKKYNNSDIKLKH